MIEFLLGMFVALMITAYLTMPPKGMHRLPIIYNDETKDNMQWLVTSTSSKNEGEMISKATALLRYIYTEHLQGSDILIRDVSGKVIMLQLGGEDNV